MRRTAIGAAIAAVLGFLFSDPLVLAVENQQTHRLVLHVDADDPGLMNLALNNAENAIEYYKSKAKPVEVEIVADGPGLHMLRADTSPVKDRIRRMKEQNPPSITFSACGVAKAAMESQEGKRIEIIPQASVVPSGIVRLMQLEEQGWSYVHP